MSDDRGWIAGRLTSDAGRVLGLALREALADGKNYIGPEHIRAALDRFLGEDTPPIPISLRVDGREFARAMSAATKEDTP